MTQQIPSYQSPSRRGRPTRASIHDQVDSLVGELRQRLGGLPSPEEAEVIWKEIWYSEAHSSTAIEGNTLLLREVEELLRSGLAVGNKPLKDYSEVKGYADAARWVYGQAIGPGAWHSDKLLALAEIRQIHALAMTPVWDVAPHPLASPAEVPGNWRQHNIRPFSRGMQLPDYTEIQARMTDWVADVGSINPKAGPIAEEIAKRHATFEQIHPFLDGNGRTGRLIMNLVLVRLGYPPAIIQKRERERYLSALDRADNGDPGPLGELIARAIINNLNRFIIPAVAGPARLVLLEALVTPDLSLVAMRAAIERGRLKAILRPDRRWRSSKAWTQEYLASRSPRGRR